MTTVFHIMMEQKYCNIVFLFFSANKSVWFSQRLLRARSQVVSTDYKFENIGKYSLLTIVQRLNFYDIFFSGIKWTYVGTVCDALWDK